jgi:hypothetical protein
MTQDNPRFPLGPIYLTPMAECALEHEDVWQAVFRHRAGDWGDLSDLDKASNEEALRVGTRILSAYHDRRGVKFWIITEADRSATTILLPDDY